MTLYSLLICNVCLHYIRNTRKVFLILCAGTDVSMYCVSEQELGCVWCPTWSRRSYAIDCEYSSSSAPAPSTYKHSTYLGPSSDTIAITISQLRTRWIFNWKCERCCESFELILVFSSQHEFVLSNLCRLYCYNLNNSINSFFQQNKFYCFILLTICLLEREREVFFQLENN